MKIIFPSELIKASDRFWDKVDVRGSEECWPWLGGTDRDGYGVFWITPTNKSTAHRVSMVLFTNQPLTSAEHVLHGCDNPPCSNPAHLRLGNNILNIEDSVRKGRRACGEQNGATKLSINQVREIKRLLRDGVSQRLLARDFDISRSVIGDINTGRIWTHVNR